MRAEAENEEGKVRVLRIIARLNLGGPAIQISGLFEGMLESRFHTTILTGYCEPNEIEFLEFVNVPMPVTKIQGLGRSISFFGDLRALISIVQIIRKYRPHIIHTHTAKAGVLGRIASIISCHKVIRIHTYHGHLLEGYFGKFKTQLIVIIERFLSYFTHELVAVGEQVRDDLIRAGIAKKSKFSVIPPGVEVPTFISRDESRQILNLQAANLVISFIGRVEQIKRPDRFLEAAIRFLKEFPKAQFLVAGDGELLDKIRTTAEKEYLPIKFLGWRPDVQNVIAASDFIVLTSDNEGIPMSLIQSSFLGVPAVATNVGSVSQVIKDGHTGLLSDVDAQNIFEKMLLLARDYELRRTLGENAKLYAHENFHVSRLVRDHERLYLKSLASQSNF